MNITGKITWVGQVSSGVSKSTGKDWSKFQAVITEQEGEYPQSLCFEVFNDKIAVALNEVCTIHFQVKANEYQGKYYTNISAWKKEGGQQAGATLSQPAAAKPAAAAAEIEDDNLPF
jgi:hypothetical protein